MTKEFEEFDKRFDLFSSSKDFITLTPPIITDKILKEIKQFISKHFLPKSKVREITDKLWDKVPKDCDEYSYHRGLNDLVSNLMDLDL